MKLILNSECFLKNGLSTEEVLYLLFLVNRCSYESAHKSLVERGYISQFGDTSKPFKLTEKAAVAIDKILIESDVNAVSEDKCEELAKQIRDLFPKGIKTGNTTWRGNLRGITLKLRKFFRLYGKYTPEEVLEATRKYIQHFNGDYTYMRTAEYFIIKNEKKVDSEGVNYIEEKSELASWLENDTSEEQFDWTVQLK